MARVFTVGYSSLQILEQRTAKRRCECCCGNSATLNQKQILEKAIKNLKTKPKPDRADKLFLLLKRK